MGTSTTAHYAQKLIAIQPQTTSPAINIPVLSIPVRMRVAVPTPGHRGVGEVTIMRCGKPDPFLSWVGMDAATNWAGVPNISANAGPASAGAHIVYADFGKRVDVQVASADAIRIRNANTEVVKVVITFSW